jgi:GNAT superfamily N-acetyltransferase
MLNVRPLSETDYDEILVGWWNDWGWTPPAKDFLPENGRGGLIVSDDSEPICAGFVYATNSKAAWCDWIVSSKTYRKKPYRREAIEMLVTELENTCKANGYKYIYALIKNRPLIDTYKRLGFTQGDKYSTEMIKGI